MPRGVPKAGFRQSRTSSADKVANLKVSYAAPSTETDAEIEARLAERFEILDVLAEACTVGNSRALIVSGAPGLGKSYNVEKILADYDPSGALYTTVKGYARSTGLIKLLYEYRHAGNVIVFDDADSITQDDVSLNILKAVADTTETRRVSWLSEGKLISEETGELIPRSFDFEGSVIFITNLDFEHLISKGHKLAPHLEAMMSRSMYLDLSLKSKRDYLVRIKQVINQGMLKELDQTERDDVMDFIETNYNNLRELSLRSAIKLAKLRKINSNWRRIAAVTMLK